MATQNVFAVPQKKKRYSKEQWNVVKPDACRLYLHADKMDEDTRLLAVMKEIERKYGLRACERTWKSKLKDWGCIKNVPTETMEWIVAKKTWFSQKGESADFFYKQKPIMPRKIRAFKRRRDEIEDELVLLDMGTPPDVEYSSQNLIAESDLSSQHVELSTNSGGDLISNCMSEATEKSRSHKIDLSSSLVTKDVDGWVSDNQRQLYLYSSFEEVSRHEDAITNHHKALFFQISELENSLVQYFPPDDDFTQLLSVEQRLTHSLDLCDIGDHLCLDPQPSENLNQGNSTPDDDSLDHLLSCAVTLAEFQCRYRELAPPTMEKHLAVAKAHENMGNYLSAEYHSRMVIDRYCDVKAERFPDMLCQKRRRHEESTIALFRALTTFIIDFKNNSLEQNAWLFLHMEILHTVLVRLQQARFDAGLSLWMHQLRAALALLDSDGEISMIYPQLVIHGFQLAHESSLLGFIQTAAWMYDFLLQYCSEQLDVAYYAKEKAKAHMRYSVLLRRQGESRSGAHQLSLACEVIKNSAISGHPLRDQQSYCGVQPLPEQILAEKFRRSLDRLRPQVYLPAEIIAGAIWGLSIDNASNFESPFTQESLDSHQVLAFKQLELIDSGEAAVEEAPARKASTVVTSTWSSHGSGSNEIGVSWSKNGGEDFGIYDWEEY